MIPKSGLFGGIPATPRNGAPEHSAAKPPTHKGPEEEFFVIVSQAFAKKTNQPAVSQPPRATASFAPPNSGVAKTSDGESEIRPTSTAEALKAKDMQSPATTLAQKNFNDAPVSSTKFFVMVSQASAKKTDQPAASQPPHATASFAPPNSGVAKTSVGESEIRPTSTAEAPTAKDIQSPKAAVPQESFIDASVLSTIMALLAPPAAPPASPQRPVPHEENEFNVTPDQGDEEGCQVNKLIGQEPPHKQTVVPVQLEAKPPVDQLPAPFSKLAIQMAIKSRDDRGETLSATHQEAHEATREPPKLTEAKSADDTGKTLLPANVPASSTPPKPPGDEGKSYRVEVLPAVNESPPGKIQQTSANAPQVAVMQDIAVESHEAAQTAGAIDGTRAALNNQRMKSVVEKNEFAGRSVQKTPEAPVVENPPGDLIGKVAAKSDSDLSGHPTQASDSEVLSLVSANSTLTGPFEGKLGEETQAGGKISTQVERVAHLVTQEVLMVRQSGANSLAVSLKVDSHTELFLQLTNHDGQIHASVRCERGNVESLGSHWGELQESLARQNVQLMPLENKVSSRSIAAANAAPETSSSRAFDQSSQNPRQQFRDPQDEPPLVGAASAALPSRKAKTNNRSRQGWETWA
jgi:hypothetical protein